MTNLDQTLLERTCRYGSFADVAKRTARIYHHMVFNAPQFVTKNDMSIYYLALHMIALKVSRLVNGEINDADGWKDIAGYAMLVHQQIEAQQEAKAAQPAKSVFPDNAAMSEMETTITEELSKEQQP